MLKNYLVIFAFLWLVTVSIRLLAYVYIWQVKEYRLDRFLDFLRTRAGKTFFFDKFKAAKLLLLLLGLAAFSLSWYSLAIFTLYTLEVLYLLLRRKFKKPEFTNKALLILALSTALTALLFSAPGVVSSNLNLFFFYFLGIDLLVPVIVALSIFLLWPLSAYLKLRTFKKAAAYRNKFTNLKVIGITGSYGKSSTKEFLATLLAEKFNILKTPKNINSEMGIANFLLQNLKHEHEVFVVEMGAYRKGEIRRSAEIVKPEIGILTAVSEQHLALFGSIENTKHAKYELIEALPHDGFAVFNADNPYTAELALQTRIPHQLYSVKTKANLWASELESKGEELSFNLHTAQTSEKLSVNLVGPHNVSNLLAAITVALHLGLSLTQIKNGLSKIKPLEKTLKVSRGKKAATIIDDSYSANPDGVLAALDYLASFENKRKVVLMPSLIELGKESETLHKRIGKRLAEVADLCLITTADHYQALVQNLSPEQKMKFQLEKNVAKIKLALEKDLNSQTVILLESRVPTSIIEYLKHE